MRLRDSCPKTAKNWDSPTISDEFDSGILAGTSVQKPHILRQVFQKVSHGLVLIDLREPSELG